MDVATGYDEHDVNAIVPLNATAPGKTATLFGKLHTLQIPG
jgi:hypothetical protein